MIIYPLKTSVAFSIFNIDVRYYGLILAFAIFVGVVLISLLIKDRYGKKMSDKFIDSCPYIIICAVIGARLFYIAGNFNFYLNNPLEMIMINHGGISIFGAIMFGIGAIFAFCKINKTNPFCILDISAVVMPLCQAIGRWGNYFNQEAYGAPSNGIIKLYVDYSHRLPQYMNIEFYHPAFLYESILDFLLFLLLLAIFKRKKTKTGNCFCLYLIFYSLIRIIVENIRTDSVLNIVNVPIATLISILTICTAFALIYYINFKIAD